MYKKILVPLDGSELAETALPYAIELAGRLGSEIGLIHVCASNESKDYHSHALYMDKIAGDVKKATKGKVSGVKTAHLTGHHAEQIVDHAEREDTGLIVMVSHGSSGVRRWVLGSVADKVVRATDRPVILIRASGYSTEIREKGVLKKVIIPLDGSKEGEAVIPYIAEIASNTDAEVTLLHVMASIHPVYSIPGETVQMPYALDELQLLREKAEVYLKKLVPIFEDKGVNVKCEVVTGATANEIIRYAEDAEADLVAMSTHGRAGITRWALGSTTDKVLRAGTTPVMLVHASHD